MMQHWINDEISWSFDEFEGRFSIYFKCELVGDVGSVLARDAVIRLMSL